MLRILYAVSEIYPLIKTGGLADVAGSLPRALYALNQDIRIVLPAYRPVLEYLDNSKPVAVLTIGSDRVRILEARLPGSTLTIWLIDAPSRFDRPGNPYLCSTGEPWPDNAERFALFCRTICEIATGRAGLSWHPDLVHCNDWQTGLVPALLSLERSRPAVLFTVHNLAYQGLFPYQTFRDLGLSSKFWSFESLEFHQQLSLIKGGLVYADRINTVSPNYAIEIQTPEFGYGLDGLLRFRSVELSGILNGIDTEIWNPERDHYLESRYSSESLERKRRNKRDLLEKFDLDPDCRLPLVGCIGRLVYQKGVDLIVGMLEKLIEEPIRFVLIGSGDKGYEESLLRYAHRFPDQIGVKIGYDEALAHLIEGGADLFLMPSRFEPCGLNQMYSLRYGTVPVVRNTGGLTDTVVDATPTTLKNETATGFVFKEPDSESLRQAVMRALSWYQRPSDWKKIQMNGMRQDFSWKHSAERYLDLYRETCDAAFALVQ